MHNKKNQQIKLATFHHGHRHLHHLQAGEKVEPIHAQQLSKT
jgi:hypothetical protein